MSKSFLKQTANRTVKITKHYYKWANGLSNRKIRLVAVFAPPLFVLGALSSIVAPGETANQNAIVSQKQSTETASEPSVPVVSEAPSETYPIAVVKTGLDFQYTYEGELQVYSDRTVVQATWTP